MSLKLCKGITRSQAGDTDQNVFLMKEKTHLYLLCHIPVLSESYRHNPPEVFLGKRCSENMQQIFTRTLMPKYDFNKVALRLY